MRRRLVLFPGMGADARLVSRIGLKNADLVAPNHEKTLPFENLIRYSDRMADKLAIRPDDIVGGVSFGGMMAAQIAARRKTAGLIVLGGSLDSAWLPPHYRALDAAGLLIPDFLLGVRSWAPVVRWRFSPVDRESLACLQRMAEDCPPRRLWDFGHMIVEWAGVQRPECPTLVVHGDLDRVIPIEVVKPDVVISGAGHAFTLTHAEETTRVLADFVARLN
jgi:pimeloyl-ACP methyl ester carboxylesterase